MTRLYFFGSLILCLLFCSSRSDAQMVGDNVFLQGHYVEIGIAPNGGYGSTLPAPAGYHPNLGGCSFNFWDPAAAVTTTSTNFLGFVADYGADGWTVGTPPYFGDYYLPGDPQEGWAIKFTGGPEADAYIPIYETSGTTGFTGGLAGTNTGYSNSGGIIKGIWEGTDGPLYIRQTTVLDTNKLYFTVTVVMVNTTASPVNNIYYIRTVDPDNEETVTGGGSCDLGNFATVNTITYQLPNPGNKVLVSTTGTTYTNDYLGLGTKDCRAKCTVFHGATLVPSFSPDSIYNELTYPYSYLYSVGSTSTEDVGIGLVFNIGTIAPYDSTSLSYAYVLSASAIDSALNSIQPGGLNINGTHFDSTDTINLCSYPNDSVNVTMPGGGFYHWTWVPDSFVVGGGTSFTVHTDSISTNFVYTITGTNTAGGCDSIIYHINFDHATFTLPAITPVSYCQYAPSVPLIPPAGGTGSLWYIAPTGGTGSTIAPTPSTTTPGITIYYVSETIGLCQSLRAPDTVNVIALPPPPFLFDPSPYCNGQPFVPFTTGGSGILWYNAASGGVGTSVSPVLNTLLTGIDTVWASQTVNGCEGPRNYFAVTILNPIIPIYSYNIHYGCQGDTVIFNNTSIGALKYLWTFGDGNDDTSTSPKHIFLTQDSFVVNLTAINAQCSDSTKDTIPLIHPVQAAFTITPDIVCQNDSVSFANTSIGSNLGYVWYFGNGAFSTSTNPSYTYANTGVYTVKLIATNFIPCHDTATGIVYVDSLSAISIGLTDSVLCRSTSVTFTGIYTNIGFTGVTWNFGDGDSIVNINPVLHSYDSYGTDTVTVTAHYRACRDTSTQKVINIFPEPNLNIGSDTSICAGSNPITLNDVNNDNTKGAKWKWSTGQTTPSIVVTTPGTYYVTVTINGCEASDTLVVKNDCYLDIPNVFTPNGDGLNDYFFPRNYLSKGLSTFSMNIYNRWGQLIFETNSTDGAGWDGKFNETEQPEGVYIYVIDATFIDGQKEHRQGNVTLLR